MFEKPNGKVSILEQSGNNIFLKYCQNFRSTTNKNRVLVVNFSLNKLHVIIQGRLNVQEVTRAIGMLQTGMSQDTDGKLMNRSLSVNGRL